MEPLIIYFPHAKWFHKYSQEKQKQQILIIVAHVHTYRVYDNII